MKKSKSNTRISVATIFLGGILVTIGLVQQALLMTFWSIFGLPFKIGSVKFILRYQSLLNSRNRYEYISVGTGKCAKAENPPVRFIAS